MSASALAAVASGQALSQPKPVFEPVEDDFIGQSGIIDMSLHGSGFGTTEQDQAGVAMTVAQLIAEFSQRTWKQPAASPAVTSSGHSMLREIALASSSHPVCALSPACR